jgi:hypothetical protein
MFVGTVYGALPLQVYKSSVKMPNQKIPRLIQEKQSKKAIVPSKSHSFQVPEFKLPEVIITGKNELTVGANHFDEPLSNITLEAQTLQTMNRSINDFPGLDKKYTALNLVQPHAENKNVAIVSLDGGVPGMFGGWGMFGQEIEHMNYLLSLYDSQFSGVSINKNYNTSQTWGFSLKSNIDVTSNSNLNFKDAWSKNQFNLPYENNAQEIHQGNNFLAGFTLNWTNNLNSKIYFNNQQLLLNYWNQNVQGGFNTETFENFKTAFTTRNTIIKLVSIGIFHKSSITSFPNILNPEYDVSGIKAETHIRFSKRLMFWAIGDFQQWNNLTPSSNYFLNLGSEFNISNITQFKFQYDKGEKIPSFYNTYLAQPYIAVVNNLEPTNIANEFQEELEHQFMSFLIGSLKLNQTTWNTYQQWTSISQINTSYFIQVPNYLNNIYIENASVNLTWNFNSSWLGQAQYIWTYGKIGNNSIFLTNLPMSKTLIRIKYRKDPFAVRLDYWIVSKRNAFETQTSPLSPYALLNLKASYHPLKSMSIWIKGYNLLGEHFELIPGYLEPRFLTMLGVTVIL